MREHREYLCSAKNVMFLLCNQCDHLITAQERMKENFNQKDGKKNLDNMYEAIGEDHIIINLSKIYKDSQIISESITHATISPRFKRL